MERVSLYVHNLPYTAVTGGFELAKITIPAPVQLATDFFLLSETFGQLFAELYFLIRFFSKDFKI